MSLFDRGFLVGSLLGGFAGMVLMGLLLLRRIESLKWNIVVLRHIIASRIVATFEPPGDVRQDIENAEQN